MRREQNKRIHCFTDDGYVEIKLIVLVVVLCFACCCCVWWAQKERRDSETRRKLIDDDESNWMMRRWKNLLVLQCNQCKLIWMSESINQSMKPVLTILSRKNLRSANSLSLMPSDLSRVRSPDSTAMNTFLKCSKSALMRWSALPKSSRVSLSRECHMQNTVDKWRRCAEEATPKMHAKCTLTRNEEEKDEIKIENRRKNKKYHSR